MVSLTSPFPSRREARRQLRRDAIVQVASVYFLEHGYAGTTMSGIAGALGGSKGTLWSYFPSKEELFIAVMDRLTEDFRTQLSVILDPGREVEQTLRRFCREFIGKITSPDGMALYRLVVAEASRFPEIGRIFNERGPSRTQQQLATFLADVMERGLLQRADPLEAARQLIAICISGSRQNQLIGLLDTVTPAQIKADTDRAMDIFLRAYAVS
jgi:AcrR family transcriptional regulator